MCDCVSVPVYGRMHILMAERLYEFVFWFMSVIGRGRGWGVGP